MLRRRRSRCSCAGARWPSSSAFCRRCAGASAGPVSWIDVVEVGIEGAGRVFDRLAEVEPLFFAAPRPRALPTGSVPGSSDWLSAALAFWFLALEQRIALELGIDELREFHVRELQQADGLLQLGCHHQLLALSQLQFGRKRHTLTRCSRRECQPRVYTQRALTNMSPEVDPAHVFIGYDFLRLTLCQNLTIINDIGPVDQAQRLAHVVIGDQARRCRARSSGAPAAECRRRRWGRCRRTVRPAT